jgi:hypothetical protein
MNDSSKELYKWSWDKVEMDGQSRPSKVTLHKKKFKINYFQPQLHWGHPVWAHRSLTLLYFVTWVDSKF